MTMPDATAGQSPDDDAACRREALRLRSDHPGWVIMWLVPARQYRAYRRLPGNRRDATLSAATPQALASAIIQAELPVQQGRHHQW